MALLHRNEASADVNAGYRCVLVWPQSATAAVVVRLVRFRLRLWFWRAAVVFQRSLRLPVLVRVVSRATISLSRNSSLTVPVRIAARGMP